MKENNSYLYNESDSNILNILIINLVLQISSKDDFQVCLQEHNTLSLKRKVKNEQIICFTKSVSSFSVTEVLSC